MKNFRQYQRRSFRTCLFLAILVLCTMHLSAQSIAIPIIRHDTTIVRNLSTSLTGKHIQVGDMVELKISGSPDLRKYSEKQLILYINELPMEDLHPIGRAVLSRDSAFKISFLLKRERNSANTFLAWDRFFRHPRAKEYPVTFSVGTSTEQLSESSAESKLELVRQSRLWLIWVITAAVGILIVILAKYSELLKETTPIAQSVFSLARTQIAWWTIIVLGSFLHLYIYTNELIDLSASTMALLGVSAATMVAAKVIDYYKDYSDLTSRQVVITSRGFLLDILSDGREGVSVHRLQFLIWTLTLTFVFLRGVIRDLAMPEFPENLLLLMGISNGTYLLLKMPENTKPGTRAVALMEQTPLAAQNSDSGVAVVNPPSTASTVPLNTTASSVTAEGEVVRRDEEDMSGIAFTGGAAGPVNPNHALG